METATISRTKPVVGREPIRSSNIPHNSKGEVQGVAWGIVKQRMKDKFVDYYGVAYDEV